MLDEGDGKHLAARLEVKEGRELQEVLTFIRYSNKGRPRFAGQTRSLE